MKAYDCNSAYGSIQMLDNSALLIFGWRHMSHWFRRWDEPIQDVVWVEMLHESRWNTYRRVSDLSSLSSWNLGLRRLVLIEFKCGRGHFQTMFQHFHLHFSWFYKSIRHLSHPCHLVPLLTSTSDCSLFI